VADRVVMAAAKIVLEPIFEAAFLPTSYGFRPALSAHHALERIRQMVTWRRKQWALDADIRSCFDEVDSHALVVQIERRVCDRRMLKLLRGWLRAGVFEVRALQAGTRSNRCAPYGSFGGRGGRALVSYAPEPQLPATRDKHAASSTRARTGAAERSGEAAAYERHERDCAGRRWQPSSSE
jgi:Reverse transcriptase (RNA-dependent DNA polymerase)